MAATLGWKQKKEKERHLPLYYYFQFENRNKVELILKTGLNLFDDYVPKNILASCFCSSCGY